VLNSNTRVEFVVERMLLVTHHRHLGAGVRRLGVHHGDAWPCQGQVQKIQPRPSPGRPQSWLRTSGWWSVEGGGQPHSAGLLRPAT
jgi:hypothetical protein